jgi:hypothetical protein
MSSADMSSSSSASNKEMGLIFFGVIISLLILGLILFLFYRRKKTINKQSINPTPTSPANSSTFAKLNSDRQQEELKNQIQKSSLNTPYISTSSYNNMI